METEDFVTPEEANKWCTELHQWIDKNHPHMLERETMRKLVDQSNYWRKAFWDIIYNRFYCPAEMYLPMQELGQLRALNEKQAAHIMELEHELRMRRNHE